jgi:hypothetical protein
METVLRAHLTQMAFPADAVDWLCDLWRVIQAFDDLEDGESPPSSEVYAAGYAALVKMPGNPFFIARSSLLLPILAVQFLKWQAANEAEATGQADERSYVWRAGFYDVILAVAIMCFGPEKAATLPILQMYGETFADYREEFPNA